MRRMVSVAAGTLSCVLMWASLALGAERLSSYNFLHDVSVDRNNEELLIQLKFRKPLAHVQGPHFFKKSIQLDFPSAYVNPSKRYFETDDEVVRQVYVSQFDRNRLRLRLILAPGTPNLKNQMVVTRDGNVLRIRIKKTGSTPIQAWKETPDKLTSLLARASRIQETHAPQTKTTSGQRSLPTASPKPSPVSLEKVEAKPTVASRGTERGSPLLSETLGQAWKTESPKESSPAKSQAPQTRKAGIFDFEDDLSIGKPDLYSASLKMAYTLVLVLGFMFVVFYLIKKLGLKNSVFGGEGKPIKVLSTGFLAPRKSIALVEVAGDILVLGIANDQISLLGNVQDPEKINLIKNTVRKKESGAKPVISHPEPEAEIIPAEKQTGIKNTPIKKQGVDVYNKRLVPPGSTNPFGEYVKQFSNPPESNLDSPKETAARVRKKLGEVPVFK